jgi:hypothetical protein
MCFLCGKSPYVQCIMDMSIYIPKWSDWAGVFISIVPMLSVGIPHVRMQYMSLFGYIVVVGGLAPCMSINGSFNPCSSFSHSMLCGLTLFFVRLFLDVWFASSISTIAWSSFCKCSIWWLSAVYCLLTGTYVCAYVCVCYTPLLHGSFFK